MARHRQGWNLTTIRMLVMVVALAHCLTSAGAPQSKIILGVLEDHVGEYIDQPDFRGVRVVFQKDGTDWKAFPSDCADQDCLRRIVSEYPGEVTWTIAFDGRNLGQITSRALTSHDFYSQIGLQQITSTNSIPTIGKKSTDYGGFIGGSVYRPLVANSQPYFKDPDRWKSVQISDELLIALRRKFRQQFPKVIRCEGKDQDSEKPWQYADNDIKLVKAYSSRNSWSVAEMRLRACLADDERGDLIDEKWFMVDPQKTIRFLGDDMWLVDAGDYDNDGKSEVLFAIDGYNRGGYELFYDDFKKHVRFEFSYH